MGKTVSYTSKCHVTTYFAKRISKYGKMFLCLNSEDVPQSEFLDYD